jgi:hypothetical protein
MQEPGPFEWLMGWYHDQCNDDWEHTYGATIDTIDNPGWSLKIDLKDTALEGQLFPRQEHNYGHQTEWWVCWTENHTFHGAGGPMQLGAMIEVFRAWVSADHR